MIRRYLLLPILAALLASCGKGTGEAVNVVIVGDPASPFVTGARLPTAAQAVRSATAEGLVGFDDQGRVIPALADRWIVTDDGQSYIFRLRDGTWADKSEITGDSARAALLAAMAAVRGTSLGEDLKIVAEVRAMAGRVIEIRLVEPFPDMLQLLAQPELGLTRKGRGTGPMRLSREGDTAILRPIAPEQRGLPAIEGWKERARPINLRAMPASEAIANFDSGDASVVLGGRLDQLPRVDLAGLSRGAVRLDPVIGLFGLAVVHGDGFLADAANREAIAMAIDRDALISQFGVGGWSATTRIIPPGTADDRGLVGERWTTLDLADRRSEAAARVASWKSSGRTPASLRIAMPSGPGSDTLFRRIRADLAMIGLDTRKVGEGADADLRLVDTVARYPRSRWFFNQLSCAAGRGLCSSVADTKLRLALAQADPDQRADRLAEAEAELTRANVFIPFGSPIRWSLVAGGATGFAVNRWGVHPLMPLAMLPK